MKESELPGERRDDIDTYDDEDGEEVDDEAEKNEVLSVFRQFDTEGDGCIDRIKLAAILKACDPVAWSDKKINELFRRVGTDSNGRVPVEDFLAWAFTAGSSLTRPNSAASTRSSVSAAFPPALPPRPAATAPLDELHWYGGRWAWTHDEGFQEYIRKTSGIFASLTDFSRLLDSAPEHQFTLLPGSIWEFKVMDKMFGPKGKREILDVSGACEDGQHVAPSGEEFTGTKKAYIEDKTLVVELIGAGRNGKHGHVRMYMEIIDNKYVNTVEDQIRGIRGSRVFKKYPFYKFKNKTGWTVELTTPGMTVDVANGNCIFVDASGKDVEQEEATFTLPDGRTYSGVTIHAFDSIRLKDDQFT